MVIKRRTIAASSLRDGMLVDFEDGEPAIASNVRHLLHKVSFCACGFRRREMIERFTFELFHCNGGDMTPDDEGEYASYEDYAALQQKLDAMAAENAALKTANRIAIIS
ncbi:hypothetical protein GH714_044124 [Hevea brasiliensis]|uniref:Uncharacterized protein n=1 Tax=Hevea brasiliensis TaxID=3981 RepID=A0A6A6K4Y4_HEVBR|nr:hypothetical protein GH714_044124 [Hevea brasiliensis]